MTRKKKRLTPLAFFNKHKNSLPSRLAHLFKQLLKQMLFKNKKTQSVKILKTKKHINYKMNYLLSLNSKRVQTQKRNRKRKISPKKVVYSLMPKRKNNQKQPRHRHSARSKKNRAIKKKKITTNRKKIKKKTKAIQNKTKTIQKNSKKKTKKSKPIRKIIQKPIKNIPHILHPTRGDYRVLNYDLWPKVTRTRFYNKRWLTNKLKKSLYKSYAYFYWRGLSKHMLRNNIIKYKLDALRSSHTKFDHLWKILDILAEEKRLQNRKKELALKRKRIIKMKQRIARLNTKTLLLLNQTNKKQQREINKSKQREINKSKVKPLISGKEKKHLQPIIKLKPTKKPRLTIQSTERKKKTYNVITLTIKRTVNNMFFTAFIHGKVLASFSSGKVGQKGPRKLSKHSARLIARRLNKKLRRYKRSHYFILNIRTPYNDFMVRTALATLTKNHRFHFVDIHQQVFVAHNGARPKKARRK